jgi:hypothetical protein
MGCLDSGSGSPCCSFGVDGEDAAGRNKRRALRRLISNRLARNHSRDVAHLSHQGVAMRGAYCALRRCAIGVMGVARMDGR